MQEFLMQEEWQLTEVALQRPVEGNNSCKLSFGFVLAFLVATGTILGSIAVGALLLTAIQSGNAVFAKDIQVCFIIPFSF
jgi:hypothetical protein